MTRAAPRKRSPSRAASEDLRSPQQYAVKEIFKTLQGEGRQAGRVAVFCRFTGCNLWNGREQDRATARCNFCDTDFVGADLRFASAKDLVKALVAVWDSNTQPFVVLTGGEPLLQVDDALVLELHHAGFEIAIETNGTIRAPSARIDWICVSPKVLPLKQTGGDELKLVFPQVGMDPSQFEGLHFRHFSLSPMDGPHRAENTVAAIAYCLEHPRWSLSLQTHKWTGIR